jgi:hypothetical protein
MGRPNPVAVPEGFNVEAVSEDAVREAVIAACTLEGLNEVMPEKIAAFHAKAQAVIDRYDGVRPDSGLGIFNFRKAERELKETEVIGGVMEEDVGHIDLEAVVGYVVSSVSIGIRHVLDRCKRGQDQNFLDACENGDCVRLRPEGVEDLDSFINIDLVRRWVRIAQEQLCVNYHYSMVRLPRRDARRWEGFDDRKAVPTPKMEHWWRRTNDKGELLYPNHPRNKRRGDIDMLDQGGERVATLTENGAVKRV